MSPVTSHPCTNQYNKEVLPFSSSCFYLLPFFSTSLSFLTGLLEPRSPSKKTTMEAERTKLPGFGLPVNYRPKDYFPTALLDWSGTILTVRELNMMAIMDKITDKPDWDKKVFDNTIIHKWRQEALGTEAWMCQKRCLIGCVPSFLKKAAVLAMDLSWHLFLISPPYPNIKGINIRALVKDQPFVRSAFCINARAEL